MSDQQCSRMFGGVTRQDVTSLGDCSAFLHNKDNPCRPWSAWLSALIQDRGFAAGALIFALLPFTVNTSKQSALFTKATSSLG